MTRRSEVSGRYWFPLGARHVYGCPDVGSVVAFEHQAWRVVEVNDCTAKALVLSRLADWLTA